MHKRVPTTFSITLDTNFKLDIGLKFGKLSKSKDCFFNKGDSNACFIEVGIIVDSNERFTIRQMMGNKSMMQFLSNDAGTGSKLHDLVEI